MTEERAVKRIEAAIRVASYEAYTPMNRTAAARAAQAAWNAMKAIAREEQRPLSAMQHAKVCDMEHQAVL